MLCDVLECVVCVVECIVCMLIVVFGVVFVWVVLDEEFVVFCDYVVDWLYLCYLVILVGWCGGDWDYVDVVCL